MHTRLPLESPGWRLKPIKETAVTPVPPPPRLTNSPPKWGKVQPSLSKTDEAPDEWLYQQFVVAHLSPELSAATEKQIQGVKEL